MSKTKMIDQYLDDIPLYKFPMNVNKFIVTVSEIVSAGHDRFNSVSDIVLHHTPGWDGDPGDIEVWCSRLETQAEADAREALEERDRRIRERNKLGSEERERELYEQLKKKYEPETA